MELKEATNQLLLRLYDWSMRDFTRELRENGPLLTLIRDHRGTIGGLLLWLPGLSPEERDRFAWTAVKMGHVHALLLRGEVIRDDERHLREKLYPDKAGLYASFMPPLATADKTSPDFRAIESE